MPRTIPELLRLPGVARKTANVVAAELGEAQGIVVDTHVRRISQRLGLTREEDPVKIERDLVKIVPRADWHRFPHLLIWHGRRVCDARKPRCGECVLADLCPAWRTPGLSRHAGLEPGVDVTAVPSAAAAARRRSGTAAAARTVGVRHERAGRGDRAGGRGRDHRDPGAVASGELDHGDVRRVVGERRA